LGLIAKEELNIIANANTTDGQRTSQVQRMQLPAWGLSMWKCLGSHLSLHSSLLLSRAYYNVNYNEGSAVFYDADLRFTQVNLNLEYSFGGVNETVKPYIFGGAQFLYRRYGTETFKNGIINNAYWPTARLQAQTGIGVLFQDHGTIGIRPFIGVRFNLRNSLVYDKSLNQIFSGIAITMALKDKTGKPGSKCPDFF
jgi:hypothetical protein